jgi:hypothetical protein
MKVFAFLLASIFVFQATTPALCMSSCVLESVAGSSCCLTEQTEECCLMEEMECDFVQMEQSCCAAEEMSSCTITVEEGIAQEHESSLPCKDCNIPCCSAPLCCFYFQEITTIDLSVVPVLTAGQLPSNNGTPHEGYHGDCFQPPELI